MESIVDETVPAVFRPHIQTNNKSFICVYFAAGIKRVNVVIKMEACTAKKAQKLIKCHEFEAIIRLSMISRGDIIMSSNQTE